MVSIGSSAGRDVDNVMLTWLCHFVSLRVQIFRRKKENYEKYI